MLKFIAIAFVTTAVAMPASADPTEQLRRALGVAPGEYSLNEMVQLLNTSSTEQAQKKASIYSQRADFERAVRASIEGATSATGVEVTRSAN